MFTVIAVFLCFLCRRELSICVHFLGHFLSVQVYVSGGLKNVGKNE